MFIVENFTWVHQPIRVKGTFDTTHHINGIMPKLGFQRFLLPQANSMFSLFRQSQVPVWRLKY